MLQMCKSLLVVLVLFSIPFDTAVIQAQMHVYPGGQSVGLTLHSKGVTVIGFDDANGKNAAKEAGIMVGDLLVSIDGTAIDSPAMLSSAVKERASGFTLQVMRGEKPIEVKVKTDENRQLGVYVKNETQGIGTVSYVRETNEFGALGHTVVDRETGQAVPLKKGTVRESTISRIEKGAAGKPGGKIAVFSGTDEVLGTITKNTPYGIFGSLDRKPDHPFFTAPIPVAAAEDVKKGQADVYTVLEGKTIERFTVEITGLAVDAPGGMEGIMIRVTDPSLLKRTGGIVQGMSGSPIIQNGKLIGAVTHVLVHDPATGYALYMEEMIKAS